MVRVVRNPAVLAAIVGLAAHPVAASARDWVRAGPEFQVKGCSMAAFSEPNFQGPSWKTRNSWAVIGWEFNDRISSIKVHAGVWQFYRGDNFQNQIETLFPGNYNHLKPTAANLISSFRCVRPT